MLYFSLTALTSDHKVVYAMLLDEVLNVFGRNQYMYKCNEISTIVILALYCICIQPYSL